MTCEGRQQYSATIDRPTSSHLGKRVKFETLSPDARQFVIQTYREVWKLK